MASASELQPQSMEQLCLRFQETAKDGRKRRAFPALAYVTHKIGDPFFGVNGGFETTKKLVEEGLWKVWLAFQLLK